MVSYTPSEEFVNADEEYYNSHGNLVAIIDEKSALSAPDFLTMQLHMTKNELITAFLKENGYETIGHYKVHWDGADCLLFVSPDSHPLSCIKFCRYSFVYF